MEKSLEFPDLLRLIDERATAFRAAVAAGSGLGLSVPTCPEWTLRDLVRHLGTVHRFWAAVVGAGPADGPPERKPAGDAPEELEALLAWSADSTWLLLEALREAGADRGCWTWWPMSQSPRTAGAVARHQVQEAAVHTYDAWVTVGDPKPLPGDVALDGVEEFLLTCVAGTVPWPHAPVTLDFHATEGRSWRVTLDADGSRAARLPAPGGEPVTPADAALRGPAAGVVLVLYSRVPIDSLQLEGEARQFELLRDWDPDA